METSVVATVAQLDRLQIRLIGDLALRRGATVIPLPPSRRTRALLGYLVGSGSPVLRSALCDLLWDGPDDPRASLRWSLTKLRPLVDDPRIRRLVADREHVAFEARDCDIDVRRVVALLQPGIAAAALAALEEAAALLDGEFLAGLDLSACYRFHHWCMGERERFGHLRRDVLRTLIQRLPTQPERALAHARSLVAADPLAELSHATLLRQLGAAGHYPEAERQYDWARELLRREIALASDGPLDAAIRAVRREQRNGATRPPPEPAPLPPGDGDVSPPRFAADALVGREIERAAIAQWLAATCPGALLSIAGEPGIGKTRLLSHLAGQATAGGRTVVLGRCFEAETIRPYGVWLDALRAMPAGTPAAAGMGLSVASLLDRGTGAENREALFQGLAAALRDLCSKRPLVVLIDDLQWIDEASGALLHFLLRSLAPATPVAFAATARTAEIDDSAPVRMLLQSLGREGRLVRLDLGALDLEQSLQLLGAEDGAALEVARQTGGNPLYLIELWRAAARGPLAEGRPLEALVEDRLRALDAPARDLLSWAAAFGGACQPQLLAAATGQPATVVLGRLARFERHGLLVETGDGAFDFAHGIIRQVVYRGLSHPLRRVVHRQIAATLTAAAHDDPQLHGDIVHHASLAGDVPATVRACLAAAEHCLRVFANRQAVQVVERGLGQLDHLPQGSERIRLEIGLLRARIAAAASPAGSPLPAVTARLERTIAAAETLGLQREAAAGWEILAFWRQQSGDTTHARDATLQAERWARHADDVTRCQQLANSGRCLIDIEADPVRGEALLDEAEALARELGLTLMEIAWGRGLLARRRGDPTAAAISLARAASLARETDSHWREYECRVWLATVAWEGARHADVLDLVQQVLAAGERIGEQSAPFAEALAALAGCRLGDARAQPALSGALAALRDHDDKAHLAYVLNEASTLALEAGDRSRAIALAREALSAARSVRRPTEEAVALACLAATAGDSATADRWLAELPAQFPLAARAVVAVGRARQALQTPVPTAPA